MANSFLGQMASKMGIEAPALTDPATKWLEGQEGPGNVRQLRNLMERCLILVDGEKIDVRDLESLTGPGGGSPAEDPFRSCTTYEEFKEVSEKQFLQQRLQDNEWNVKRTAESLGMQRSNLYKKMERYGLK